MYYVKWWWCCYAAISCLSQWLAVYFGFILHCFIELLEHCIILICLTNTELRRTLKLKLCISLYLSIFSFTSYFLVPFDFVSFYKVTKKIFLDFLQLRSMVPLLNVVFGSNCLTLGLYFQRWTWRNWWEVECWIRPLPPRRSVVQAVITSWKCLRHRNGKNYYNNNSYRLEDRWVQVWSFHLILKG